MVATIVTISALLLAVFGINTGFGLQATLLGVRAGIEGFPLPMIGIVMALFFVGYIAGSLYFPRLINQIGHIRTFAAMASVASSAALLHAVFVDPWSWMFFRALTGFCQAGLVMVAESWLNHASSNKDRGSMLSIYMLVSLGATAIGQLLLNVAAPEGFNLFILVSVLVSIALVPVTVTRRGMPTIEPTESMAIKRLFAISPTGVVACFSVGLINGAFWGMGAVFAQMSGLATDQISFFMAAVVIGGIVTQWPIGKLSDKIDRRLVLIGIGGAIVLTSLILATIKGMPFGLLLAAGGVFGMAALPLYAISIAHVNDMIPARDFVPASSKLLVIYGVGAVTGPFIGSTVMDWVGPGGLFLAIGIVAGAMSLFCTHRMFGGHAVQPEQKEDFITMPQTGPMAIEMAAQVNEEANAHVGESEDTPTSSPQS